MIGKAVAVNVATDDGAYRPSRLPVCRSLSHADRTQSGMSVLSLMLTNYITDEIQWICELGGESEPEVEEWLSGLSDEEFGHVEFYVDLLAERGRALREPYNRNSTASFESCGSISAALGSAFCTTTQRVE